MSRSFVALRSALPPEVAPTCIAAWTCSTGAYRAHALDCSTGTCRAQDLELCQHRCSIRRNLCDNRSCGEPSSHFPSSEREGGSCPSGSVACDQQPRKCIQPRKWGIAPTQGGCGHSTSTWAFRPAQVLWVDICLQTGNHAFRSCAVALLQPNERHKHEHEHEHEHTH